MGDSTKNQAAILSPASLSKAEKATQAALQTAATHLGSRPGGPQLLFSGEDAVRKIAAILPTAATITVYSGFGPVELRPGTIWGGNRMLVAADSVYARYAVDARLYESGTASFLRDEWFGAAGRAVAQAELFIHLAQFEIALLSGLFVPWYLLLGVSVASLGLTYHSHRDAYNAALREAPAVIRQLKELRQRSPTLFDKLVTTAARDVLVNLPAGVTGEDVGFFLGRVVRGVEAAPAVTLGVVLKTTIKVGALVSATHLPKITAEAVKVAAQARAAELQKRLAEQGITVTPAEAEQILSDLLMRPDTADRLREMQQSLGRLIPVLERLSQVLHR
jgi:hypothetical protein